MNLSTAARRRPLHLAAAAIAVLGTASAAHAEGSRNLFPAGYTGSRANLDLQPAQVYVGAVRRRTFVYVFAQSGEYLLLGSSNRIDGNTAGNIRVYNPQPFGQTGDETIPAASDFDCVNGATGGAAGPHYSGDPAGGGNITGAIGTRANELAGPRSADGTAGGADTWLPCAYRAPTTGLYGVLFEVSDAGGGPNGAVDPPARSNNSVAAWEVAVRADAASTTSFDGRAFTYAFAFFTGANSRPVNSSLYYVTLDGFRYRQDLRNFDPNGYALYANASGFLDAGEPLYKSVRGGDATVFPFVPAGTGITAQRAQYPAFFADVDPAGPNAAEVARVLGALSIPLVPVDAQLNSVSFAGAIGSDQTVVNLGGTFTLNTSNTLTFQIVISRDGVDYDPANPNNRVLTGLAPGGAITATWDGRDNAGVPFPVGNFPYRTVGRNGEVHFPAVDAEGNPDGGPTVTRLNGPGTALARRTVYFDDRGYVTANGTTVGVLNGTLCPAGSGGTPPAPPFSLLGVDSSTNFRAWPGNGNSNADCVAQPTSQGFGDAKGLDLWTHVQTTAIDRTIEILGPVADLAVTKDDGLTSVLPGGAISYAIVVSNNGPSPADGALLTDPPVANFTATGVSCGSPTGGAACPLPAAVSVAALQGAGIPIPTFPANGSVTFTVTGTAGTAGSIVNVSSVAAPVGTTDPVPGNNSDPDTTGILAPELALAKTNGTTQVTPGGTTTYTLTVSNIGAAPTFGAIRVVDVLPAGIGVAAGAVPLTGTNAAAWTCTAAAQVLTCDSSTAIAPAGSSVFAFTAAVAANVVAPVVNRARVGGGGDPLNPNLPTEGDAQACTANGTPRGCAIDTDGVPAPVLAAVKTVNAGGDGIASPGEVLTYTIVVSNTGGPTTAPTVVTDPIPANTSYVAGSATGPGAAFAANTVSWSIPAGASFPVTLTFQVTVANPIPAGVSTIANTHTLDGLPGCATPPCTVTPTPATLGITKSVVDASGNGLAEPGETLTYTITLTNNGGSAATNVSVRDPIDANTTFVSASNGGTAAAGVVTWTGLSVPANGSLALTLVVTVNNPLPAGVTAIRNSAVIGNDPLPDCTVASPPANCTVVPVPRIALTKTTGSTTVQVPGSVGYTITVANVGGAPIANVVVSDPLPTGITGFAWTCTGTGVACPAASGSGAINQTVPNFPVGASLVYAVNATVAANAPPSILNQVTVTPTTAVTCTPSNQPAPCQASVPVTTVQAPTLVPVDGPALRVLLLLALLGVGLVALRGAARGH
jgi:uncharacterized repeat protein (TIGR01451 family)